MFLLQASAAGCNKQHNPQLDFLLIICNIKDLVLVSETSLQLTMGWILSSLISFLACSSTTGGKVKEDVVKEVTIHSSEPIIDHPVAAASVAIPAVHGVGPAEAGDRSGYGGGGGHGGGIGGYGGGIGHGAGIGYGGGGHGGGYGGGGGGYGGGGGGYGVRWT